MKTLHIKHGDKWYACSLDEETLGHVTQYGEHNFKLPHPSWKILGFSTHWMQNYIVHRISPSITVEEVLKGYVWDSDHGTTRQWGGGWKPNYVREAYIEES